MLRPTVLAIAALLLLLLPATARDLSLKVNAFLRRNFRVYLKDLCMRQKKKH